MKLTTINNPVALRLDTTVGTRIFAGNTMIYGDTGWRNVAEMVMPETIVGENVPGGFQVRVRRVGHEVYWVVRFRPHPSRVGSRFYLNILEGNVPDRFRENPVSYSPFGSNANGPDILGITNELGYLHISITNTNPWADKSYSVSGSYTTTIPWPTTLPGLPA